MADVFVSYSRADRGVAEALANDLKACGLDVWWDRELNAGDDFLGMIATEIAKAKATVVIWSKTAVMSKWVRGEANEAVHLGTLISTHVHGFKPGSVPVTFRCKHCGPVDSRERILAAIERKRAVSALRTRSFTSGHGADDPRCPDKLTFHASVQNHNQNYEAAALLYSLAADQGAPEAQYQLATMYEEGRGVPHDEAKAVHLFSLAAFQGYDEARGALERLRE